MVIHLFYFPLTTFACFFTSGNSTSDNFFATSLPYLSDLNIVFDTFLSQDPFQHFSSSSTIFLLFNLNLFFLHTVWISLTKHSLHTFLFISFPAFPSLSSTSLPSIIMVKCLLSSFLSFYSFSFLSNPAIAPDGLPDPLYNP